MSIRTLAWAMSVMLSVPATADERTDALLDLAARAPLSALAATPGAFVHVADMAIAARGVDPLAAWERAGSPELRSSLVAGLEGAWTTRVGFGPTDVEATLTILALPRRALVFRLAPSTADAVEPALIASGYESAEGDGQKALARGDEDFAISLSDRDPADPLGGDLGMSGRALVQGHDLLWANEWPLLLDLAAGTKPDPRMKTIRAALELPAWGGAELVQGTLWLTSADFAPDLPPPLLDPSGAMPEAFLEALGDPGIPPWSLALLADMAPPDGSLALVIFVYADRPAAEEAAERLVASFPTARSLIVDRSWTELTGAATTTHVAGDGPFATILALRGDQDGGNRAYRALLHGWQARDLPMFGPG